MALTQETIWQAQPDAVTRLGTDVFITTPLYRSQRQVRPIYINRDAYLRLFNAPPDTPWDEMADTISTIFSTTIEAENGTGDIVGTAWVDRQADPLGLSLAGNGGSGRAYYLGPCFNIKGERTPLATSPKKQFSDGFLELERAIWETLVANGLQGSLGNGLCDILAIIDMNDTCDVVWREKPVARAKVIRIDNGSLDRVSHLFQNEKPVAAQDLHDMAAAFGRLEADKFAGRIIHGNWSPGNISPAGHLIDFDTVATTKGRGPVYMSTRWYHQNRFGFEQGGQAAILSALADDKVINTGQVTTKDLHDTLYRALHERLVVNFVSLMGFDTPEQIIDAWHDDIVALCHLWQELARKAYATKTAHFLKEPASLWAHVFDVSRFMALYPLLRRQNETGPQDWLALMLDNPMADDLLSAPPAPALPAIEQEYMDRVEEVIGEHLVQDADTRDMLGLAALGFIKKYDRLMQRILSDDTAAARRVEALALSRNADSFILFPAITPTFRMAQQNTGRSNAHLNAIITSMIHATRRHTAATTPADIALGVYDEGAVFIVSGGDGHAKLAFIPHRSDVQAIEIKWENSVFTLDESGQSNPVDLLSFLPYFLDETALHTSDFLIYSQNEHIRQKISLTPL